ncbi:MAG: hypothetical protein KDE56_01595 [Anaerolineales bacterium]|nr:hypothetical protein [Anaerolineales bacterium]
MFARLSNSWELVKASWHVLLADKELLIFPIISFVASLIVMATFAIPTLFAGLLDSMITDSGVSIFGYIVAFLFYVTLYTVTIFANAALVGAAMIRLKGGDPTVGDGFQIATQHLGSIVGYAVIAATVGMILRAISERSGQLGRAIVSLIGFAWGIATFLVVPVLVVEEVGPMEAVKRSAGLLKQTWGEQIAGNFSIGLIFGLLTVVVILLGVPLAILAAASNSIGMLVTVIVAVILLVIVLALISSTLSGIYTAAVYRYATTGDTGGYFDANMVKGAFKVK